MEHILQIGICVDDKAIEEGAMKSLSENLSRKIGKKCLIAMKNFQTYQR